ncbi:MAG: hypothetical protein Ta2A_15740 [Treponemataceae bacterium]|nr:MAG: hypothetical protein Ta2A_15740 [Treponemataceae bacterium]
MCAMLVVGLDAALARVQCVISRLPRLCVANGTSVCFEFSRSKTRYADCGATSVLRWLVVRAGSAGGLCMAARYAMLAR